MTGCTCHDPAVFGHLDCDQAAPFYRALPAKRHRGEGPDRALNRRLAELRADELLAGKRGNAHAALSMKMSVRRYR